MTFKFAELVNFLLLFGVLLFQNVASENTEYKFIMDKLVKDTEAADVIQTNLAFEKEEGKTLINGEMNLSTDLNDEWKVNVTILRADNSDGEYIKFLPVPQKGVCQLLQSYYKTYFYESLKNYGNVPEPDQCPLASKKYFVNKYPLDCSKFKKFLKPGYYRVVGVLLKNNEEKLKYSMDGHVEEV